MAAGAPVRSVEARQAIGTDVSLHTQASQTGRSTHGDGRPRVLAACTDARRTAQTCACACKPLVTRRCTRCEQQLHGYKCCTSDSTLLWQPCPVRPSRHRRPRRSARCARSKNGCSVRSGEHTIWRWCGAGFDARLAAAASGGMSWHGDRRVLSNELRLTS